jgi:hypothetical protein
VRSPDSEERLDDARSSVSMLFPAAEFRRRERHDRGTSLDRTYVVAPSVHHARLLIPRHPGDAAAIALRSYGGRLSTAGKWGYRCFGAMMQLTGGRSLGPTFVVASPDGVRRPGIDDHLSGVLGETTSVAMQLSPPRANRKPVLQALISGRRTPAAFVKVGTNPLTRRLASQEAQALTQIAAHPTASFVAPAVIDFSDFEGLSVLTLQSLPTWAPGRTPDEAEVITAAAAIADLGPRTVGPLTESALWQRLDAEIASLPPTPVNDRLRAAHTTLEGGAMPDIETGGSHGDYSPWNMWRTADDLLVWDWERFSTGVPIGSDLIHYHLQELWVDRVDLPVAARTVIDRAPHLLRRCVTDPAAARVTALVHLLALAVRYETDGQAESARLRRTQDWLLPVIEAALADVHDRPRAT